MCAYFVGIDIGTGSARAGVFDLDGNLHGFGKHDIQLWRAEDGCVEQSSEDIWLAIVHSVRAAIGAANVPVDQIEGIGFDATCSLVLVDSAGKPVSASLTGDDDRNIIVWMDHRALSQADAINATGHPVLDFVGGCISPEMQMPKLAWLKQQLPQSYHRATHFFDLADYLTYRCTGRATRSLCTLVCKWNYMAHNGGWRPDFLEKIGLGDLASDDFARIGRDFAAPGQKIGALLPDIAAQMGLAPGIAVSSSLIDAHAGAVATLGGSDLSGKILDPRSQVAYIVGTSACCMSLAQEPQFVSGLWGPFYSAIIPGLWLSEGGQSAAGAALDALIGTHLSVINSAERPGAELFETLEHEITLAFSPLSQASNLCRDFHVLPDLNGNRSPFADPKARGMMIGLDLREDRASLHRLYVAILCALAYGIRDVIAAQRQAAPPEAIVISGGAARSKLLRQIVADATGLSVHIPQSYQPVLLGSAMLGAVASGRVSSLEHAMSRMTRIAGVIKPDDQMRQFHQRKYNIYKEMQALERRTRALVSA